MTNARFGPYELLEEIGKGGMATVYRAYQPTMDRYVAVKVIHQAFADDLTTLERFRREARLIAHLEHPHILPLYDFDGAHQPPYIVMRYLGSGTLKEALHRARLPFTEIGYLFKQLGSALDYAHRQGIIHRDVKPSNVMLDPEGHAFVGDFGIARLSTAPHHTLSGAVVGTPDYMAPEQVMGLPTVDGRADVYALGVMLFQILTGRLPYVAETPMAVMLQHLQAPIPSATALNDQLPPQLDEVLAKAMAKEPSARWASAGELALQVNRCLGGDSKTTSPMTLRAAAQASAQNWQALRGSAVPPTPTPHAPTEQNKIMTVLCVDAADLELLEVDPLPTTLKRQTLRAFITRLAALVQARGGQLTEQTETGGLAVWGLLTTGEDDAEQAVRAALDLQAALQQLLLKLIAPAAAWATLPLRLVVHTGPGLIAPRPGDAQLAVSGPVVNIAQRLADEAEGSLVISHDTFREVEGVFDLAAGEPVKIRGRKESLAIYRILGAKARAFRIKPHGLDGVETPFVGRGAELKQLQDAYLTAFEDNETQLVTVVGAAGLGKSRLWLEFHRWADLRPETCRFFQARATPAMTSRPYALLRDLWAFRFEILDDDPLLVVQAKIERGMADMLGGPDLEMAHVLGHLAGFDFAASPHLARWGGDPAPLVAHARQLFLRFFERLGQRRLMVVVLEDLHSADEASLDLFSELTQRCPTLPLILISLARPELLTRRPHWGRGAATHTPITLQPLNKRDSRDLVREVLRKLPEVPRSLRDMLVERAEGNPLFMEELVKMLLEDRVLFKKSETVWEVEETRLAQLKVPPTLRGVLQARFDTLLLPEKQTLQRAAVVGRAFYDTALVALAQMEGAPAGDLPISLKDLEARGFIERREGAGLAGSVEYWFAQALLRDLIYETLLDRQRRAYHAAYAAWLAQTERTAEMWPLIAEHYAKGPDPAQAAAYFERAGDQALQVSAFAEAIALYQRAQMVAAPQFALSLKLADAYYQKADFAAARTAVEKAWPLASTPADRAAALALLGEVESATGHYAAAQAAFDEALPLAQATGSQAAQARVLYGLGDVGWRQGELTTARTHLNASLALADEIGDTVRRLFVLNRLGTISVLDGDLDVAERLYLTGQHLAQTVGNRERVMTALNNLGEVAKIRQQIAEAQQLQEEALSLARTLQLPKTIAPIQINVAHNAIRLGQLVAARAGLREGLALAHELGLLTWVVIAISYFANLAYAEGDTARALALWGLAHRHPAFSSDTRRAMHQTLAQWHLPAEVLEAGLAQGAALDFDQTVQELLRPAAGGH